MKNTDVVATDSGHPPQRAGISAQRPGRMAVSVSAMRHRLKRFVVGLAPLGTVQGRVLRSLARGVRQAKLRVTAPRGLSLAQVLAETSGRCGIVIHPPFIDWCWMRQRPQQLMTQFAKAGYLSLYCSPRSQGDAFRGFARIDERLYLCDSLRTLYDIPNAIVLANWTDHWDMVRRFRSPVVIYDYMDDLGVSSGNGVPDRRKLELHRKFLASSDVVLATARRLYEEVKPVRSDAMFCPNGVDYEHFHTPASSEVPADIADLVASGRPIIGYYGALARWFDYDLVAHAARARSDCEFLLIGPDFDGTLAASRLTQMPNVHWIGEKRYEELPAYLHHFAVATIPFLINDITVATCPIKLFEYMAAGKPIVTTPMPECCLYDSVFAANDRNEFVHMLGEALEQGQVADYRRQLDADARDNTWEARVGQILARIERLGAVQRRSA